MKKYYDVINQIDEIIFQHKTTTEIIDKDYPNEKLNNIDYEERKHRLNKINNELNTKLQLLFNELESIINDIRKKQPRFDKDLTLQKRNAFPEIPNNF